MFILGSITREIANQTITRVTVGTRRRRRRTYLAFCPVICTLPLLSSTTGQSECTEDEAMLQGMEDGDETSSSTPEPEQ